MPSEWNPEWYAFPWLALPSFTYTVIPFRPTRTTTFFVVLSNRVQLACIRPTRRVLQFMRTGPRDSRWHNDFSHRCAHHESEQHNESLEKETTRSNSGLILTLSLSLSLCANDSTMESLQEVSIITALKLTLLQSCSLGSYNSSHSITSHTSNYANTYTCSTVHFNCRFVQTPVARTAYTTIYTQCSVWNLARAWYSISLRRFLTDGRTKRIGSKRVPSVTRAACTRNMCIVYRVSCTIGISVPFTRLTCMIFTRIRQINISWQECTVNGDLPDLLGWKSVQTLYE